LRSWCACNTHTSPDLEERRQRVALLVVAFEVADRVLVVVVVGLAAQQVVLAQVGHQLRKPIVVAEPARAAAPAEERRQRRHLIAKVAERVLVETA
jgi:hypothetical protein